MRDHAIGTFGAVALILVLSLKFASISFLMERPESSKYLVLAPAMARWTIAVLAFSLPYARSAGGGLGAAVSRVSRMELLFATVIMGVIAAAVAAWSAIFFLLASLIVTALNGWISMRRIQGITGDTMGSNIEICEALLLATGCFLAGHR
jgi:adenosylcobinamide-GDP ribazoletransferase